MNPQISSSNSPWFWAAVSGREEHQSTRSRLARRVAILALVRRALAVPTSKVLWAVLWLALLCTSAPQAFAPGGIPLWTNRYNGPANLGDSANAVAVDNSGNVFVTGESDGDYVTIKYSSSLTQPEPTLLSIARDGNGGFFIHYTGVPVLTYRLQRAVSPTGPWSDVATNTAPTSSRIEYHETTPPPSGAFYRAAQPVQD